MKRLTLILGIMAMAMQALPQGKTDISLFMRSDSTAYLDEVSSETGDLYSEVGHHGPAVENEWLALRLYFDHKCVIDVYSKARAGLELREERWYPDASKQKEGWGADYYKVGSTVGLGGVRLWDGKQVVPLDPVTKRTARVHKEGETAIMEMISEGVPYLDRKVDILVRVSVTPESRMATVEAVVLKGGPLQMVSGINYHKGQKIEKTEGLIATWGEHPEDVAAEKVELGAAILYDPADFIEVTDDGKQFLLISFSTEKLSTRITSANAREPELNTMEGFWEFLLQLQ